MLTSLALIFLVGLAMTALCQQLHLPRIIGMLVTGILLGPCVLNALNASILSISSELRQMALIIILIKAGLSLNLVLRAGQLRNFGLHPVCARHSGHHPHRSRRHGGRAGGSVPGSGHSAHGAADRERMGHEKKHPSADSGGCFL